MPYPMQNGGPYFRITDLAVLWRRVIRKLARTQGDAQRVDISDNQNDRQFEFLEYPLCESCGENFSTEVLIATDGNRIVECRSCSLWYTSPRIIEEDWIGWLCAPNPRNEVVTENRLQHGIALSRNIPLSFSFWWRIIRYQNQRKLKKLIKLHGGSVKRVFDVGCGSGLFLKSAKDLGVDVSGNDLNNYAVEKMNTVLGVDAHLGQLEELISLGAINKDAYEIVHMNDFIEHSYHPKQDIEAAHEILKKDGLLYVRTFCVDSDKFNTLKEQWDMLMWNHCFHFTSNSLSNLITQSSFSILSCTIHESTGIIELIAKKS